MNIKLGEMVVELADHASPADAWALIGAHQPTAAPRIAGAALGLAWPAKSRKPKADLRKHGYDLLSYGGAIFDELIRWGASPGEILEAGRIAYAHLMDLAVGGDEVEAEANFSPPTEDASTG